MTDSLELPIEVASHRLLSSKEIKAVKTAIEGKILKLNKLEWTGNLRLNVTWLALSKVQPTRHEMSEPLRWTWLRKVLKSIVPVLVCSCLSSNVLSLRLGNFHCLPHLILAAHNFGPNYFRKSRLETHGRHNSSLNSVHDSHSGFWHVCHWYGQQQTLQDYPPLDDQTVLLLLGKNG